MTTGPIEARRAREIDRYYAMDPVRAWARSAVSTARRRAKKHGLPFEITASVLVAIATTHCPALGLELDYSRGRLTIQDDSPTVDRIVPPLGYVVGNVVVISNKANAAKGRCSPEELFAVGRWHGKQLADREEKS